jgi:hypothetical protein
VAGLAACLALAVTLTGEAANARSWGEPTAALWAGSLGQKGKLYASRDTDCGPMDCVTSTSVGRPAFPEQAFSVGAEPREVKIDSRLEREKPPATTLRYWRELDDRGRPVGEPVAIEHRLKRIGLSDWRLRFTTSDLAPEAFVDFRARWRDDLGTRSYARFGFHISE